MLEIFENSGCNASKLTVKMEQILIFTPKTRAQSESSEAIKPALQSQGRSEHAAYPFLSWLLSFVPKHV